VNQSLAALLFWISVVISTIAELAIVAATVRASRRSAGADSAALLDVPQVEGARPLPRQRRWLELLYVVTPAVVLLVLFVFTWRALPPAP
jgi:heme/copper-type cytochrome/quinol oxidase subunit 2